MNEKQTVNKKLKTRCDVKGLFISYKVTLEAAVGEQGNMKIKLKIYYLELLNFKDPLNKCIADDGQLC